MKLYLRDGIESIGETELQPILQSLPAWRLEQALRYKHLGGRRECALSFLLLAEALHECYGISDVSPFSLGAHGKPFLADHPQVHFNLSHCKKAVLCALHDGPVGVDVECVRSFTDSLLDYTMCEREKDVILSASDPRAMFTSLWTRKEAVVKLTGEGVGSGMHHLLDPQRLEQEGIAVTTAAGEGYFYSVASYRG